jgi:hypothetical protein
MRSLQQPYSVISIALLVVLGVFLGLAREARGVSSPRMSPVARSIDSLRARNAAARCPKARPPTAEAPGEAAMAVLRQRKRVFQGIDSRDAGVFAAASLNPGQGGAVGLDLRRYITMARRACGHLVARRSWAVFAHLPRAPTARTADAVVLSARTADGWIAWYVTYPALRTGGFVR